MLRADTALICDRVLRSRENDLVENRDWEPPNGNRLHPSSTGFTILIDSDVLTAPQFFSAF